MTYEELNSVLAQLDQTTRDLEAAYIENEGECTATTDAMEADAEALRTLLASDGIDMLGSWLKAKEDRKKALKAEKDYVTRQMTAIDSSIDFVKHLMYETMTAAGMEKAKGVRGYTFVPYVSETTSVNKDHLVAMYEEPVKDALVAAHIPPYVKVTLGASASLAKELGVVEGDEDLFCIQLTPTVKFTKPRASKE